MRKRAPYKNWFTFEKGLAAVADKGPNECWDWPGLILSTGYGGVRDTDLRLRRVHRVAYERLVGPIPAGLVIDHLCRNKACFNPRHLEAVTVRTNTLRGVGTSAWNARKTHCDQGHPFDEGNTIVKRYKGSPGERRVCRTCQRRIDREAKRRLREARLHARLRGSATDPSMQERAG